MLISAPLIFPFALIGTKYVAFAISLRATFLLPLYVKATHFLTGLSTYQALKIALCPYLVAFLSAGVARAAFEYARVLGAAPLLALALSALVGGIAFLGLFWRFGHSELRSIVAWRRA